jgi:RNA polymerase sigma-70 factor (ECF subfamily)
VRGLSEATDSDIERAGIVRLCAHLTGDPDAAEDLAQETLLAAWRHEHALREPEKRQQWLAGIARNVCLMWARRRGRELSRLVRPSRAEGDPYISQKHIPAEDFDIEVELERAELASLLDRALALLPPATRDVLIARYIEDSPQKEVAARLRMSEAAVGMRVQRGKLYLRRALMTRMPDEAAAYGLLDTAGRWQETRMWCPRCGERRLEACWAQGRDELRTRCLDCDGPDAYGQVYSPGFFDGIHAFKPAISRVMRATDELHREAVREGPMPPCPHCRRRVPLLPHPSGYGFALRCITCGSGYDHDLPTIALALPAGRTFWRDHPRVRTTLSQELDVGGTRAVVVRLESLTGTGSLAVAFSTGNYRVLAVHGPAAAQGDGSGAG